MIERRSFWPFGSGSTLLSHHCHICQDLIHGFVGVRNDSSKGITVDSFLSALTATLVLSSLREYANKNSLNDEGGIILRPWMLNYDPNLGLRGFVEPDPTSALNKEPGIGTVVLQVWSLDVLPNFAPSADSGRVANAVPADSQPVVACCPSYVAIKCQVCMKEHKQFQPFKR